MQKFSTIVLAAAAVAASIFNTNVAKAETHNFANYNVRYTNPNNGDNGDKLWANRGPYVVQLIKDYDFDVVGMEEVTGLSGNKKSFKNPNTGRSQLEDLKAWLSDYDFKYWERSGNNNAADYSYNAIAYKRGRYTLLDSGCFWLSPTPDRAGSGWDPSPDYSGLWRTCGWVKLKVKTTGEELIFAVIHCNYGPSLDGLNGGELVSSRLREIAGNLPIMLVGDFNMRRTDHKTAYRGYAAHFDDAAVVAPVNKCLPETNPQVTITAQNWYPVTSTLISGSEFDFTFCRNMTVESRHIITEFYGRSVNPSDHFPVMVRCTLNAPAAPTTLYVDADAAGGNGTIEAPFKTISQAVAASSIDSTIHVAEGIYSETLEPQRSLTIIGGYNKVFSDVVGKSELAGNNTLASLVSIPQYYSLTMENFVLTGAASKGAISTKGTNLTLRNVDFVGNCSNDNGGAINAVCTSIDLDGCTFDGNSATNNGGAVYLSATNAMDINHCAFLNGSAKQGVGAYIAGSLNLKLQNSTFAGNNATRTGALHIASWEFNQANHLVNNTFANNTLTCSTGLPTVVKSYAGAAIYATLPTTDVKFNMAHCTVVGNTASFAGTSSNFTAAAINITNGAVTMMNNIVAGNFSNAEYCDVSIQGGTLAKELNNVYSTTADVSYTLSDKVTTASSRSESVTELAKMLDGSVVDGKFVANVVDNGGPTPTVAVRSSEFATKKLNTLTTFQRLVETSFGADLDGDGAASGYLKYDQRGAERLVASMPGAVEFVDMTSSVVIDTDIQHVTAVPGGVIVDNASINIYDLGGRVVVANGMGFIPLTSGVYIVAGHKIMVK